MSDLRRRAREKRKARKMTQQQVADAARVSLKTYQAFESGATTPQAGTLTAIAEALELDGEEVEALRAQATRESWPTDVQQFLDAIGAYVMTLGGEDVRVPWYGQLFRQIWSERP